MNVSAAVPGPTQGRRWTWWLFVTLEVLAVLAVPLVAFVGVRALLGTTAGTFLSNPEPDEPGFQALLDPTPVLAVVERRDGTVTGITLLSRAGVEADGGAVVLVPAELEVEGRTLAAWGTDGDAAAVDALARALRLALAGPAPLDTDGWEALLGDVTVTVDSPDPVLAGGVVRFPRGTLELAADDASDWLGLPGNQGQAALLFRRQLWWESMLDAAPTADLATDDGHEVASTIDRLAAGPHRVELLPVRGQDGAVVLDAEAAEQLVVEVVPLPAGAQPGDRLRVRVLDRTGGGELDDMARAVARAGAEVVVVGNASEFDSGPTEALIATASMDEAARRLVERIGTGTVTVSPGTDDTIDLTVLAGPDLLGPGGG